MTKKKKGAPLEVRVVGQLCGHLTGELYDGKATFLENVEFDGQVNAEAQVEELFLVSHWVKFESRAAEGLEDDSNYREIVITQRGGGGRVILTMTRNEATALSVAAVWAAAGVDGEETVE